MADVSVPDGWENQSPDVIGLTVQEAEGILASRGIQVVFHQITSPPWPSFPQGERRVVRLRFVGDNQVSLVSAYHDYQQTRLKGGAFRGN